MRPMPDGGLTVRRYGMSEYELVNALAGLSGNIDTRKSGHKGSDPIFH